MKIRDGFLPLRFQKWGRRPPPAFRRSRMQLCPPAVCAGSCDARRRRCSTRSRPAFAARVPYRPRAARASDRAHAPRPRRLTAAWFPATARARPRITAQPPTGNSRPSILTAPIPCSGNPLQSTRPRLSTRSRRTGRVRAEFRSRDPSARSPRDTGGLRQHEMARHRALALCALHSAGLRQPLPGMPAGAAATQSRART
jgi:hypothetical protein